VLAHIVEGTGAGAVVLVRIIWLIAYALDDDKRWARFRNLSLFVVFLVLAIAAGWWLLADGGIQILLHDFGQAGTATSPVALALR